MKLIDADKLIEEIQSYRGDIFANEVIELIKQFPEADATNTKDGDKWIPADHPPETDENNSSEDVIVKVKWWDDDITYDVGYYRKKYGWSTDCDSAKAIAWFPLPEICRQKD